jgi:DNA-binding transcriptional MerR regulator
VTAAPTDVRRRGRAEGRGRPPSKVDAHAVDRGEFPYRMKDLCDRTGLPRQVIHFYILEGLVPEGEKTGRNMAYYGESHLERLKLVRQLQHERFLPLRAIRAVLNERDENADGFSKQQRHLLLDVKHRLGPIYRSPTPGDETALVPLKPVLLRAGVKREDVAGLAASGMLAIVKRKGRQLVARDDVWMIELWGELRAAGFTKALGFVPEDATLFAESIEGLFEKEKVLLKERLSHLPPEAVAKLVEAAVPLLNQLMSRYHESLVRKFFASIQP